jgi:hypothetical protein
MQRLRWRILVGHLGASSICPANPRRISQGLSAARAITLLKALRCETNDELRCSVRVPMAIIVFAFCSRDAHEQLDDSGHLPMQWQFRVPGSFWCLRVCVLGIGFLPSIGFPLLVSTAVAEGWRWWVVRSVIGRD